MIEVLRPYEDLLVKIDFAQNYAHSHDTEFAQEHFSPWQSTVLPVVCYYNTHTGPCVETLCVISSDLSHDSHAVQTVMHECAQLFRVRFRGEGGDLKRLHAWSDGATAHFKQKNTIGFLSCIHQKLRETDPSVCTIPAVVTASNVSNIEFVDMKSRVAELTERGISTDFKDGVMFAWNFSGSYHGKGPSDSENAIIKGFLAREEEHGRSMPYTKDLIPPLVQKLSFPTSAMDDSRGKRHTIDSRTFIYHEKIPRRSAVSVTKSIKDSKSHYCYRVVPTSATDVKTDTAHMSFLSCACPQHMAFAVNADQNCPFKEVVHAWNRRSMRKVSVDASMMIS